MNGFYIFTGKDGSGALVKNRIYCLTLTGYSDGSITARMLKAEYKWNAEQTTDWQQWQCSYAGYREFKANWERLIAI